MTGKAQVLANEYESKVEHKVIIREIKSYTICMMKYQLQKVLGISLATTLTVAVVFMYLEPSLVGASSSASDGVVISLQVDTGISISSPADTYMSTSLGVVANTAIATTTWNVKTNNSLGYSLTLAASTNPAMQVSPSQSINDFATTTAPELWSTIPNGRAEFGYSAYGTDVSTGTYGTGSSCSAATSTPSTSLKYRGFTTSASPTIATRNATTTTSGIDTVVCYAVEQKGVYVASGTYTATITATATTL